MLKRVVNAIRRNHALEHATISILLSRHGPNIRVLGRAAPDGFYIYGDIPTDTLRELANEGLARLAQKHFTTSPELNGVRIVSVEPMGKRFPHLHKVSTASVRA